VKKAVQETTDRISADAGSREQLLKKEFDGEKKVLTTKIEALEKTVKEQHEQITKLTQQLEKSYQKVEDIAVKAVQSASAYQSAANLHQMITEQARKQSQEK
jgi:flagellar motility protein MotE (MotC chaperone)